MQVVVTRFLVVIAVGIALTSSTQFAAAFDTDVTVPKSPSSPGSVPTPYPNQGSTNNDPNNPKKVPVSPSPLVSGTKKTTTTSKYNGEAEKKAKASNAGGTADNNHGGGGGNNGGGGGGHHR